jgi:hypothetical protein
LPSATEVPKGTTAEDDKGNILVSDGKSWKRQQKG